VLSDFNGKSPREVKSAINALIGEVNRMTTKLVNLSTEMRDISAKVDGLLAGDPGEEG